MGTERTTHLRHCELCGRPYTDCATFREGPRLEGDEIVEPENPDTRYTMAEMLEREALRGGQKIGIFATIRGFPVMNLCKANLEHAWGACPDCSSGSPWFPEGFEHPGYY